MNITHVIKDGVVVCYVDGEITLATSPAIKEYFKQIEAENTGKVLFNFEKVKYIDSLGMATIIGFMRLLQKQKAVFAISNVEPKVISILKITKIDRVIKIFDSEKEALTGI